MSSTIEVKEGQQSGNENAGTSTATEGQSQSPRSTADALNLTTLDKIKRFFFSKEEWEAYLVEKLEEQRKREEGKNADQNNYNPLEDPNDKRSVVAWIRTVFPSQEDANSFLKLQLEKLQEVKDEKAKQVNEVKEVVSQKPASVTTIATAVQPVVDTNVVDRK